MMRPAEPIRRNGVDLLGDVDNPIKEAPRRSDHWPPAQHRHNQYRTPGDSPGWVGCHNGWNSQRRMALDMAHRLDRMFDTIRILSHKVRVHKRLEHESLVGGIELPESGSSGSFDRVPSAGGAELAAHPVPEVRSWAGHGGRSCHNSMTILPMALRSITDRRAAPVSSSG